MLNLIIDNRMSLKRVIRDYQLIELDDPHCCWENPEARTLFEHTTSLKFQGYGRKYPHGVVPVDTTDWIATHYLVCKKDEGLQPTMGFKRVTLERCQEHYLAFPPYNVTKANGYDRHHDAMKSLMSRFETHPELLSYTGAFTISPNVRGDSILVKALSETMIAIHHLFHQDAGKDHEIITAGVVRFHVEELLTRFGFQVFGDSQGSLEQMVFPYLARESVQWMHGSRFNSTMEELSGLLRPWWDSRTIISKTAAAGKHGRAEAA
jgi:hypothetical protein